MGGTSMRSTRKVKVLVVGFAATAVVGFGIVTTMPANAAAVQVVGNGSSMDEARNDGVRACQAIGLAGGSAISGRQVGTDLNGSPLFQMVVECAGNDGKSVQK
jgi:hypothetical protein